MRRPLVEARKDLEENILARVSDFHAHRFRQLLEGAERQAREYADAYAFRLEQEAMTLRDDALRELTDVRDQFDVIAASSATHRAPAREQAANIAHLRERQTVAEAQLDRADELADIIEAVEENPIAWYDDQASRLTHLAQDLPW